MDMSAGANGFELISSPANALVKLARQLATRRRARHREGLFLIEGERAIRTAIENQTVLHTIVFDNERIEDIPLALVRSFQKSSQRAVTMEHPLFMAIADADSPQPVLALARIHGKDIPSSCSGLLVLDAIRDPGNLGTIIRAASAAGVEGIALLPGCVDPYNPKAVRASAGTVTALPIARSASISSVLTGHFQRPESVNVLVAEAGGTSDYRDVDWKNPFLLVVGNEAHGVSESVKAATTRTVRIPMAPGVESLNVAVATGVLLFEMRSHRSA